jgi:hypothetical protein
MTTHYNGSRGPVEIASMPYRHLCAARDKLVRDGFEKERAAEVEAMSARIAELDADYAAAEAEAEKVGAQ